MAGTGSNGRTSVLRIALLAAGISTIAVGLSACQSDPDIDITAYAASIDPADQLYNEGLANIQAGNLTEASRKFEAIDKQHPYSEYSRKAMVMNAFVQYRQGQNQEAINSARRFINLYPNDPDAAYAQYIIGLAYFKQIPSVTRDQSPAVRAMRAMQEVVDRYPESEYVEDAEAKIRAARDQIAGKEMQIGRFYERSGRWTAAQIRFQNVIETYQTTSHAPEALYRLTETSLALGIPVEAKKYAAVLGANYPGSEWYEKAFELVQDHAADTQVALAN